MFGLPTYLIMSRKSERFPKRYVNWSRIKPLILDESNLSTSPCDLA